MKQEIKDRIEKIKNGEIPEGYKVTKIGVIPIEWNIKNASETFDLVGGNAFKSTDAKEKGIRWLKIANVDIGNIRWDAIDYLPNDFIYKYPNYLLKEDDIVMALTRPILNGKLKIAYIKKDDAPSLLNQRVGKIEPRENLYDRYIYHYLSNSSTVNRLETMIAGTDPPNLGKSDLDKLDVIYPAFTEQQKIATILSTWDKAIELKENLIEEKKKQKRGLMQKLLTGEIRLLGFDGEWKEDRLGDIAEMNSGGTPKSTYPEYYDGNIPWVSISDMTKNGKYIYTTERNISELGLNNSSAKLYPIDTVLFAMYASIGECSISKVELSSSQAILGIRPGSILNNEYLYYYLTSIKEKLKLQGQQGTQSNLNAGMIKELRLWLPEINEQLAIVNILTTSDKEISFLDQELEALKQQKKGLMQLLLTGIVRVNTEN